MGVINSQFKTVVSRGRREESKEVDQREAVKEFQKYCTFYFSLKKSEANIINAKI